MNVRLFSCALGALLFASAALALDPPPGGAYYGETTALGENALANFQSNIIGLNTAIGHEALYEATIGSVNTAVGDDAMHETTEGSANVGIGYSSLYNNTTGAFNTAIGHGAMEGNIDAYSGTAVGCNALQANKTGGQNTAIGYAAMTLSTGAYNTAVGTTAMAFATGMRNVAVGVGALNKGGSGSNNTVMGYIAGETLTGSNNIVIGYFAGSNLTAATSSNNIEIGTTGTQKDANVIRLGDPALQKRVFIAGVGRSNIATGVAVMVNNQGELGIATSSARYKREIKPMEKASEAILSLKPVSFRYKKELDPQAIPQFGLVAEEVAKVDRDLVARDEEGKPYTVRYEAVNAMLLNEFLKEHRKVEKDEATMSAMKETLETQTTAISELKAALQAQAAQLQKVNEALQRRAEEPRLVSANQ